MRKIDLMQRINQWHQTRVGLVVISIIEAGLLYLFASLAIDSGSLLDYTISFLLLVAIIQNGVLLVYRMLKGRQG